MGAVAVESALYLSLSALFDEERPCEQVEHSRWPEYHAGAAQWYVHVKHECGHDVVKAYCGKFKQALDDPDTLAICAGCSVELSASEVIQSTTRIGS